MVEVRARGVSKLPAGGGGEGSPNQAPLPRGCAFQIEKLEDPIAPVELIVERCGVERLQEVCGPSVLYTYPHCILCLSLHGRYRFPP